MDRTALAFHEFGFVEEGKTLPSVRSDEEHLGSETGATVRANLTSLAQKEDLAKYEISKAVTDAACRMQRSLVISQLRCFCRRVVGFQTP